ncbi:MAG: hypothetical protein DRI94_12415 [Bacteroidetes bacterium]|nr:MAG: hypothetical protein DRI94_12415 [Bacteroidota bacterium]
MVKKASYIFIIFLILGVLISCNKNKKDAELALISEYLEEHNITEEPQADGLYLIETGFSVSTSSESDFPQKGDTVIVIYKGYLLSNASVIFDEKTIDEPAHYVYLSDNVIKGWEEAVGMMKKDVSALIIIPSDLAYKGKQTGIIPPYSTLIFEVRIIDIRKP